MKNCLIILMLLSCSLFAQEEALDPSIFDGTGREQEVLPPEERGAAESTDTPEAGTGEDAPPASAAEMDSEPGEQTPLPPAPTLEPEEIILPESEASTEEEIASETLDEPGIPSGNGTGPSRAGERVESTEKIAPGQAVDYPWDI